MNLSEALQHISRSEINSIDIPVLIIDNQKAAEIIQMLLNAEGLPALMSGPHTDADNEGGLIYYYWEIDLRETTENFKVDKIISPKSDSE